MSIETNKRPLVTFALLAYNQEDYIRDAMEGAFSQTYSPLELLVSDDCSMDNTFEVIKSVAAGYTGPHRISIVRNERNLGIGAHLNRIFETAKGEWVVFGAGDDISRPERVTKIVECWGRSLGRDRLICSGYSKIDSKGEVVSVAMVIKPEKLPCFDDFLHGDPYILGAVCAIHREVWERFPRLNSSLFREDHIFPMRALLLGSVGVIQETLVDYRVGVGVSKKSRDILSGPRSWMTRKALAKRIRADLDCCERLLLENRQKLGDLVAFGVNERVWRELDIRVKRLEINVELLKSFSLSRLWRGWSVSTWGCAKFLCPALKGALIRFGFITLVK